MLRLGVHPNNLHLRLARLGAGPGDDVAFVDYADGRQTADLLADGAIDLGGTGSTPPLTAQARGVDIVYLAASAPRPANGAVLVGPESSIARTADLAGRAIALVEGSFHTALLARLAERHGLALSDYRRTDLAPAASAEALRSGVVEAWVAMDPHLRAEAERGEFRVLAEAAGLIPNRSVFWASRRAVVERPESVARALSLLSGVAERVRRDPDAAARALAAEGEADAAGWRAVLLSRDWRLHAIDAGILAEQQEEADLLARHGALARPIRVADDAPPLPFAFAA